MHSYEDTKKNLSNLIRVYINLEEGMAMETGCLSFWKEVDGQTVPWTAKQLRAGLLVEFEKARTISKVLNRRIEDGGFDRIGILDGYCVKKWKSDFHLVLKKLLFDGNSLCNTLITVMTPDGEMINPEFDLDLFDEFARNIEKLNLVYEEFDSARDWETPQVFLPKETKLLNEMTGKQARFFGLMLREHPNPVDEKVAMVECGYNPKKFNSKANLQNIQSEVNNKIEKRLSYYISKSGDKFTLEKPCAETTNAREIKEMPSISP